MEAWGEDATPVFYDTDAGRKMTLAKSVEVSGRRYSIMRSTAPRLPDERREDVPFGAYNTDRGAKCTMEVHSRDNRRFYSSSFDSAVPRFRRPWTSPVTDVFYDPDRLKDHQPSSVAKALQTTPIQYAIHRSRYKRFPDRPILSEAPDVTYDTDCPLAKNKASMYTEMVKSPVMYRNMGAGPAASRARGGGGSGGGNTSGSAHLGPGAYDTKCARDISVSPALESRPLSSMASGSTRFGRGQEASRAMGQPWSSDRANKHWGRGVTISKTEYLRPQYLPRAYEPPRKH